MTRSTTKEDSTGGLPVTGRRIYLKLALVTACLGAAVWAGFHFGHLLPELEGWISGHGALGYVVFIAAMVVCTSLFVPDTVFALLAGGLLFWVGLGWGATAVMFASLLTACVDFGISGYFLGGRGRRWLDGNPKLRSIEKAAAREGLPFLFLLRLTPISPVTVNYVLGITRTRFPVFLLASFGMLPGLFVEVYFGYVAKHSAKLTGGVAAHSPLHLAVNCGGLAACVVVLVYVTRIARRAMAEQAGGLTDPGDVTIREERTP